MFHFRKPLHDTLPATRSLRISSALPIKEATQSKIHNMWLTVDHIMQCFLIWFRLMVHTLLDHHKVLLSTGTREVHLMSSYATTPIKILYFISLYALKQVTWNIHTNETTITLACSEPKALSNTSKANCWPRRAIHKKKHILSRENKYELSNCIHLEHFVVWYKGWTMKTNIFLTV